MNYRNTPHSTTGMTPNELIFGRKIQTNIPCILTDKGNHFIKEKDKREKMKMKTNYDDRKCKTKPDQFKIGDRVLLKRDTRRKNETVYSNDVYKIIKITGTQITAQEKNRKITRNLSFFKLLK